MSRFPAIEPVRLFGDELITEGERVIGTVKEYWSWAHSNLVDNAERGTFAEFLVRQAVGSETDTRINWDKFDILSSDGIAIEVKSSGYIQSWKQENLSKIRFSIRPALGWDKETNTFGKEQKRQSAIYVFCVQAHKEQDTLNPLDISQWEFYVTPTVVLDKKAGNQKSISLDAIIKLGAVKTAYSDLKNVISKLAESSPAIRRSSSIRYTNPQFAQIVYDTAQWINEILVQDRRWRTSYKYASGDWREPWNKRDEDYNYAPERLFLITAIYHAIKGLKTINRVISEYGDNTFQEFLTEICNVAPWGSIRDLRDMNEHKDEYIAGGGSRQDAFESKIKYKGIEFQTNAFVTLNLENGTMNFHGKVDEKQLIKIIKKLRPKIQSKLRLLFYAVSTMENVEISEEEYRKMVERMTALEEFESSGNNE